MRYKLKMYRKDLSWKSSLGQHAKESVYLFYTLYSLILSSKTGLKIELAWTPILLGLWCHANPCHLMAALAQTRAYIWARATALCWRWASIQGLWYRDQNATQPWHARYSGLKMSPGGWGSELLTQRGRTLHGKFTELTLVAPGQWSLSFMRISASGAAPVQTNHLLASQSCWQHGFLLKMTSTFLPKPLSTER